MATRYHKVSGASLKDLSLANPAFIKIKFFGQLAILASFLCARAYFRTHLERQKAVRRINSTKHQLEDPAVEGKAKRKLAKSLFEQRVDLNYVLVRRKCSLCRISWLITYQPHRISRRLGNTSRYSRHPNRTRRVRTKTPPAKPQHQRPDLPKPTNIERRSNNGCAAR